LHDVIGSNALSRFGPDALAQAGVQDIIVMLGINDFGFSNLPGESEQAVSADDVISGYRQFIARAHARGIHIFGATLTPFEGAAYYSPEAEAKPEAANKWIRTSGEFDGVIDFEAVVRDPEHPTKSLATFDSGDHLHPSDAGYKAMGDAVDLALFSEGDKKKH
jgi:lysophospholipase L1-like esterase